MIKLKNKKISKLMTIIIFAGSVTLGSNITISNGLENNNNIKNGWALEDNNYYYYKDNLKQNGWSEDTNGKWYWLKSDGVMASNKWIEVKGKWYRFYKGGAMLEEEWYQDNKGGWYWLKVGGVMACDETIHIKGKTYKFSDNGKMLTDKEVKIEKIIDVAHKQIGKPYRWGSSGPNSFDCSGLTSYVYKNGAEVSIPRTSREQGKVGKTITKSNLKEGDLVFFNTSGSGISHVGLYIGDSKMIHAPSAGKNVKIENINSSYYSSKIVTAKRIL